MSFNERNRQVVIFSFAFFSAIVVNILSWKQPFFWDTLLTSSVTQFYFENGFGNLILPHSLDAGHPPFFYVYVVLFYKFLGLNLFAAHLSMLFPCLIGIWSLVKIVQYFQFDTKMQFLSILTFFFVPAVLTQYTLVSYDTVLLNLYLLSIYSILYKKYRLLMCVAVIMCAVSTRGVFINLSLFLIVFYLSENFKKSISIFFPSAVFFILWTIYHSIKTNSVISLDNDWRVQRRLADFRQILMNLIALARIFFDFGIILLFTIQTYQITTTKKLNLLQVFWIVTYLIMAISFVFLSNPIGHRYFLIVYVFMLLASLDFLYKKHKNLIWILFLLPLGHFQIYGNKISNGWDCSLAHLSYFSLRNDFSLFMKERNIAKHQTGTVMPLQSSDTQYYLSGDTTRMININGKDINDYKYILFSNICNDFSDEQLDKMTSFSILKKEKKGMTEMILYQNKTDSP